MYAFDYQRPADRAGAKSAYQGDARYLAGGQSLIQAMKLRLSASERLVDLGGIADLKGIKVDGGNVVIGAMTTHAAVAASADVRKAIPALAELTRRPATRPACSAWVRRCTPTSARSPPMPSSPASTRPH